MADPQNPPDGAAGETPVGALAGTNMDGAPGPVDGPALQRRLRELQVDRDRWKARGLDAERRYRERELALRQLREDVEDLRRDRDAWREQTDALTKAIGSTPEPKAEAERVRAAAKRKIRAAWEIMPEPGKRLARPIVQRVRARRPGAAPAGAAPVPERQLIVSSLSEAGPEVESVDLPEATPEERSVTETVSVIIPTLNGGPDFVRALDAIRLQEGLAGVELLVVDSGSTDGTQEVARSRGARVVEIAPGEFSHGGTRDRMAAEARGEVLVMTVQDAVLAGRQALRNLVLHLTGDPSLAAVSARQVPRLDCDLFGAFIMYAHTRATLALPIAGQAPWFPVLTLSERRALCAVDNVCAAIRREAWESVHFRDVAFAEDLDFGLRAVEQGWKIATATDVTVVHSHRRSARYHLGRFLVDRLTVAAFLGDPDRNPASLAGLDVVAASSVELLRLLEGARAAAQASDGFIPFAPFLESVASALSAGPRPLPPSGELEEITGLLGTGDAPADPAVTDLLRDGLLDLLHSPGLKEFSARHPFVEADDAGAFAGKAAALVIGAVLGDSMRDTIPDTPLANRLRQGI